MKDLLIKLKACNEAIEWAETQNYNWENIYKNCERGDWLLWLFKKTNPDDLRLITLAKGRCVEGVVHLMKDERSKKAVQAAIDFGEGSITREELNAAADAAYAAAYADAYAAAAAYATYAAAYAAADAAYADAAAAYAAYAAADARMNYLHKTADIVRKIIPIEKWNINP